MNWPIRQLKDKDFPELLREIPDKPSLLIRGLIVERLGKIERL